MLHIEIVNNVVLWLIVAEGTIVRNQICRSFLLIKRGATMLDVNKYKMKRYIHFDRKVKIETVESYVTNPKKIAEHSFLPFIHYITSFEKNIGEKNFKLNNRPIKLKTRDIMYAGHLDNYIYKYYADNLNNCYNQWMFNKKMDKCSTAYRNNKEYKSNIDFAAEVINKIVDFKESYILVGDFTHFFDQIDHKYLKMNLLTVLNLERLERDWFNVYKSITKYGYYEKEHLIKKYGTDKQIRRSKKNSYFSQLSEFRKFQKQYKCISNTKGFGIPQGTAISAVFANIYAINFDSKLKEIADKHSGLYRRYSDDFILVLPKEQKISSLSATEFKEIEKLVRVHAINNKIEIQEEKTGMFEYTNSQLFDINQRKISRLDYLGFVFDGKKVEMRAKSPYKFYRKAYQLIDKAEKIKEKKSLIKLPYRKQIYGLYTDLGRNRGSFGNFISYAWRAQQKFDKLSPIQII